MVWYTCETVSNLGFKAAINVKDFSLTTIIRHITPSRLIGKGLILLVFAKDCVWEKGNKLIFGLILGDKYCMHGVNDSLSYSIY